MEINSNKIGNYGPSYIQSVKQKLNTPEAAPRQQTESITHEEKKFFVNMYPENKEEIIDYHYYQKSGKMSGVSLGSLFDKKG